MPETDKLFSGSIPEIYDEYLVPMIFRPYAEDLAARVVQGPALRLLETAAGSGVVARRLAPLLDEAATYVVTDLNPPMLNRAQSMQPDDPRLSWRQADALALPFDDGSFDVVLCQFGVMFFPDRVEGYREALRVLEPEGRYIINVWDRLDRNEITDAASGALGQLFPDDPPLFMARTPHGYGDPDRIEADLRAAGFGRVTVEAVEKTGTTPSARHAAIGLCQGNPLRAEIEARDPGGLQRVTEAVQRALETRYGDGPISGPLRAYVATAQR